jgi:hypothetical protein
MHIFLPILTYNLVLNGMVGKHKQKIYIVGLNIH